jgi:hypothetical protein
MRLQQLKERKSNNKGSALVMVVCIMAIVSVLAVALMLVSLITYKMKITYSHSQNNFYDAEAVMDDINVGLQHKLSDAAGAAYAYTLENYSGGDATAREAIYFAQFETELLNSLADAGTSTSYMKKYSLSTLQDMVVGVTRDASNNIVYDANGAMSIVETKNGVSKTSLVSITSVGDNNLELNEKNKTYTIKNLQVKFVDSDDYMTVIKTDIVLSCPDMDFTHSETTPLDLTSFSFIAGDTTTVNGGNINVEGNVYLGDSGADFDTGTVNFDSVGDSCRLITSGALNVYNKATLNISSNCSTWAQDINVNNAAVSLKGITYLSDDIVLEERANVTAEGILYAYGSPDTSKVTNEESTVNSNMADYSSAILINGYNTTLNLSGLKQMIIAGNAYVNATKNPVNSSTISDNKDVMMGESIALKSSQRAYMVPAEYIAPYCTSGGKNPMSSTQYAKLQTEMYTALSKVDSATYQSVSDLEDIDFVRTSANASQGIPAKLAQYGVTSIQKEVYPLSNGQQLVYFFLVFGSEDDANQFAASYYSDADNLSSLNKSLDKQIGISLPNNFESAASTPDSFTFYYNGCVLVPDGGNTKVLTGQFSAVSEAGRTKLQTDEMGYQKMYAALCHKLVADWNQVTEEERKKDIYTNLVGDNVSNNADVNKKIPSGDKKVIVSTSGDPICAVVANGDYEIKVQSGASEATETVSGTNYAVHVVIASGDVTVSCDYEGLIIAKGKIIIQNKNLTASADANLAQQALRLEDSNGVRAIDYLEDGDKYLVNSGGNKTADDDTITLSDHVTYDNWEKQ